MLLLVVAVVAECFGERARRERACNTAAFIVVEAFVAMILAGAVAFSHADERDFEPELDTRSIKNRSPAADHRGELRSLAPRGNAVV